MKETILLVGNFGAYYRSDAWAKACIEERYNISVATQYYFGKKGLQRKILAFIFYYLELFIKLPFAKKIVILPMNHYGFLPCYAFRFLFRYRIYTDFYVSFYDTGIDRKNLKFSYQAKFKKWIDKLIIEKSDLLIHFSMHELKYISDKVGANLNNAKVSIIPLSVPLRKRSERDANGTFNICWWGTFIPLHGIDKILKTSELLKEADIEVKIYLFGVKSKEKDEIVKYISDKKLHEIVEVNTEFTFSNGKLTNFLHHNCDLALGVFGDSEKAANTIANKILDAASMGLPVLTRESGAVYEYFSDSIFYTKIDPIEFSNRIIEISNKDLGPLRESIYNLFVEKYSLDVTNGLIKGIVKN